MTNNKWITILFFLFYHANEKMGKIEKRFTKYIIT